MALSTLELHCDICNERYGACQNTWVTFGEFYVPQGALDQIKLSKKGGMVKGDVNTLLENVSMKAVCCGTCDTTLGYHCYKVPHQSALSKGNLLLKLCNTRLYTSRGKEVGMGVVSVVNQGSLARLPIQSLPSKKFNRQGQSQQAGRLSQLIEDNGDPLMDQENHDQVQHLSQFAVRAEQMMLQQAKEIRELRTGMLRLEEENKGLHRQLRAQGQAIDAKLSTWFSGWDLRGGQLKVPKQKSNSVYDSNLQTTFLQSETGRVKAAKDAGRGDNRIMPKELLGTKKRPITTNPSLQFDFGPAFISDDSSSRRRKRSRGDQPEEHATHEKHRNTTLGRVLSDLSGITSVDDDEDEIALDADHFPSRRNLTPKFPALATPTPETTTDSTMESNMGDASSICLQDNVLEVSGEENVELQKLTNGRSTWRTAGPNSKSLVSKPLARGNRRGGRIADSSRAVKSHDAFIHSNTLTALDSQPAVALEASTPHSGYDVSLAQPSIVKARDLESLVTTLQSKVPDTNTTVIMTEQPTKEDTQPAGNIDTIDQLLGIELGGLPGETKDLLKEKDAAMLQRDSMVKKILERQMLGED